MIACVDNYQQRTFRRTLRTSLVEGECGLCKKHDSGVTYYTSGTTFHNMRMYFKSEVLQPSGSYAWLQYSHIDKPYSREQKAFNQWEMRA